jgi:hypothetical protein
MGSCRSELTRVEDTAADCRSANTITVLLSDHVSASPGKVPSGRCW